MTLEANSKSQTQMASEIDEIPVACARQVDDQLQSYLKAGREIASRSPSALITCARGSSDHAALYLKYLVELRLGLPVCSMGPSVASQYNTPLNTATTPLLAISQSGGSKDICDLASAVRKGGGYSIAFTNASPSPLEDVVEARLPLAAGREKAVAATKSYTASLIASVGLVAGWANDKELEAALKDLPDQLEEAVAQNWSAAIDAFQAAKGAFIMSRGPGLAIAMEAALKLKETCQFHAEAFSAAEVRHGPVALAKEGFLVMSFASRDQTSASIADAETFMRKTGTRVLSSAPDTPASDFIPSVQASHALLDPICQVASFYRFVEQLSARFGLNPDAPDNLKKVTVTA